MAEGGCRRGASSEEESRRAEAEDNGLRGSTSDDGGHGPLALQDRVSARI